MSALDELNEEIREHYANPGLEKLILDALADAGKDVNSLEPEDLEPIDEFHIRGREATLELAAAAGLEAGKYVLDVGCGIGGPSRCIAHEFGCRVTGIDLTQEYCRLATRLAKRVGLSDLVDYRQGDAPNLDFPDSTFDVVWTQHVGMNIPNKERLYEEIHRVLKRGGVLAIYDILQGPSSPVLYPAPWASTPGMSFLETPEDLRPILKDSGFTIASWEDKTAQGREWFVRLVEEFKRPGKPPLGFHVLLGDLFDLMGQNERRNLEEERIVLAQIVAWKV